MPTGISLGERIVRDTVSDINKTNAPIIPEAGRRYRLSVPAILLAACGAIKPIKPITPEKAIVMEDIKVTSSKEILRSHFTETPMVDAVSSPAFMALKSHAILIRRNKLTTKNGTNKKTDLQLAPQKPPISQLSKFFSASAPEIYFNTETPAENKLFQPFLHGLLLQWLKQSEG